MEDIILYHVTCVILCGIPHDPDFEGGATMDMKLCLCLFVFDRCFYPRRRTKVPIQAKSIWLFLLLLNAQNTKAGTQYLKIKKR